MKYVVSGYNDEKKVYLSFLQYNNSSYGYPERRWSEDVNQAINFYDEDKAKMICRLVNIEVPWFNKVEKIS